MLGGREGAEREGGREGEGDRERQREKDRSESIENAFNLVRLGGHDPL